MKQLAEIVCCTVESASLTSVLFVFVCCQYLRCSCCCSLMIVQALKWMCERSVMRF